MKVLSQEALGYQIQNYVIFEHLEDESAFPPHPFGLPQFSSIQPVLNYT